MSIFRNLFGKKAKLPAYENNVFSYVDQYEGKPVYYSVDLGLADLRERQSFSVYIAVILPAQIVTDQEPPISREELEAFHALEGETFADAQRLGYLYAGHAIVTAAEHMYIAFYCRPEDKQTVTDSLNRICQKHGRQPTMVLAKDDPEWAFYTDRLAPEEERLQELNNADIVEELKSHGDDGSVARPVNFWMVFPAQADCDAVVEGVKDDGYEKTDITDGREGKDGPADPERPFELQLVRTMAPTLEELNPRVKKLVELARSHNGLYDGTETEVVRPDGTPMEPPKAE